MKHLLIAVSIASAVLPARADFMYEQTTRITGGAMAALSRNLGGLGKKIGEPIATTTILKGNKMAVISAAATNITDLDAGTMTSVNHERQEYSVMTFEQMKEMMAKVMGGNKVEMADGKAEAEFDFDVKETGRNKTVAGQPANEVLMTMIAVLKNKQSKESADFETQMSIWLAKNVPGYGELTAFYQRMAAKMGADWTQPGGGAPMGVNPSQARAMAAMASKMRSMEGVPMLTIMRMAPKGQMPPAATMGEPKPAPAAQQAESQPNRPSVSEALGGALGGRFGLGRRKKEEPQRPEPTPESANQAANADAGLIMETTTETTAVSSAPQDAAKFAVPAGYKQVESPLVRRAR